MVSVTAVVYDKAGHFIRGLGIDDIEVYEDGVRQEVSYFREAHGGEEKIPLSIVLVLDSSGSMSHNLHFLQEAAINFIYKLEDIDEALVIQFNNSIKDSREFTADIDRLERLVDGMQAWGGTSLFDSIHHSLNRIRDRPGRKALVVFSDGSDTTSMMGERDVIDYARAVEASVYSVGIKAGPGFVGGSPRGFLEEDRQGDRRPGVLSWKGARADPDLRGHLGRAPQPLRAGLHPGALAGRDLQEDRGQAEPQGREDPCPQRILRREATGTDLALGCPSSAPPPSWSTPGGGEGPSARAAYVPTLSALRVTAVGAK